MPFVAITLQFELHGLVLLLEYSKKEPKFEESHQELLGQHDYNDDFDI